ncbi:MAG TPA: hypothetical protein VGQ34_10830, partial [Sphingomicrobium sp.]|nr:hypothetical protein [Sphingomicrobium sp.]
MADNPFEAFGREFKRAMEEHGLHLNEEMKRVHEQMRSAIEQMKGEMERVGVELGRAMEELHREHGSPADWFRDDIKADVEVRPEKPKSS